LSHEAVDALVAEMPQRRGTAPADRRARFEAGLQALRVLIGARPQ
jgi:hypothetical protein